MAKEGAAGVGSAYWSSSGSPSRRRTRSASDVPAPLILAADSGGRNTSFARYSACSDRNAGGGTRTRKGLLPGDFKSPVFTISPPRLVAYATIERWATGLAWATAAKGLHHRGEAPGPPRRSALATATKRPGHRGRPAAPRTDSRELRRRCGWISRHGSPDLRWVESLRPRGWQSGHPNGHWAVVCRVFDLRSGKPGTAPQLDRSVLDYPHCRCRVVPHSTRHAPTFHLHPRLHPRPAPPSLPYGLLDRGSERPRGTGSRPDATRAPPPPSRSSANQPR